MPEQQTLRFKVPALMRDRLRYALARTCSFVVVAEQNCDYRLDCIGDRGRVIIRQFTTGTLTVTGLEGDSLVQRLSRVVLTHGALEPRPASVSGPVPHPLTHGQPRIGSDESGKGDFFGPLVVAAVAVGPGDDDRLAELGARDGKGMAPDEVERVARQLADWLGDAIETVVINPSRYNELYDQVRDRKGKPNLNELLAWAHSRAISNLWQRHPRPLVVTDQFAPVTVLGSRLQELSAELVQFPGGEVDRAVAAASVVARAEFRRNLQRLAAGAGVRLPAGAGPEVVRTGREVYARGGRQALLGLAKLHFKTMDEITGPYSP